MLEGTLVLGLFFYTVLGLMDFGRMVWIYTTIAHGAREATRFAMVNGTSSGHPASIPQIQAIVPSRSPGLSASNLNTQVTFNPSQSAGSTVKVVVSYSFTPIAPFIPAVTLKSSSQMVIYQ